MWLWAPSSRPAAVAAKAVSQAGRGRQRRGRRGLPALGLQNTQVDPQHKEVISLSLFVVARVLVSDNILCAASFPSPTNGKKKNNQEEQESVRLLSPP